MHEESNHEVNALRIVFGISAIASVPALITFAFCETPLLSYVVVLCFATFNLAGLRALQRPKPNLTIIGLSVGLAVQFLLFIKFYYLSQQSIPPYAFLNAGMIAVLMALVMSNYIAVFVLWASFACGAFLIFGRVFEPDQTKEIVDSQIYLARHSIQIFAVLMIASVALRRRIQQIQEKLQDANQQLEQRVEERTAELQSALDDRTQALHDLASSKDQLVLAQKTESIGQLSGGITHDFNNLLTVILSATYFIRDQLPKGDPMLEDVEAISNAGERASALTDQLLAFSRQDAVIPEPISLNAACTNCIEMVRRLLGSHVQIQLDLQADRDIVLIDPSQLDQVLVNLSVNARDAMPSGGIMIVRTKNIGNRVQLQVEDNGEGISDELKASIFDPFVTNKPKGVGTGLGLSIVAGIIQASNGMISVDSEIESGTTFKIHWPIADAEKLQPTQIAELSNSVDAKTVLVVDNDIQVLRSVQRTLNSLGYKVLTTDSPAIGLKFVDYEENIDLLLSDLVMPEVDGLSFVREFVSSRPVPVLLMTGHVPDNAIRATLVDKNVRVLNKPFRPDQLAVRVKEAIAESGNTAYDLTQIPTKVSLEKE